MFTDNIFSSYVDQVRPMAQSAATELRAFGHRVLSRLDTIIELLDDDDFTLQRTYPEKQFAANSITEVATVPAGEEWELEVYSAVGTGGATVLIFDRGGATVTDVPKHFLTLSAANVPAVAGGNSVVFEPRAVVYVLSTVAGSVRMQFKRKRLDVPKRMRAVPGVTGGPALDGGYDTTAPEAGRHAGDWAQH